MKFRHLLHREMEEAASVHRAAFDGQLPWLSGRHTPAEDTFYFSERVFPQCQGLGADGRTGLIGIIAFRAGWIEQLYVLPPFQGAGIGTALLDIPKGQQRSLRLWTFQRNHRARSFYERRGFVALEQSDGTRNEEREPDIFYEWRTAD